MYAITLPEFAENTPLFRGYVEARSLEGPLKIHGQQSI